jgi:hypothetical protein
MASNGELPDPRTWLDWDTYVTDRCASDVKLVVAKFPRIPAIDDGVT